MFIPKELQTNKFEDVAIPSNRTYFARAGQVAPQATQFTGDMVAPMNLNKVEQIEDYRQFADRMAEEQLSKSSE